MTTADCVPIALVGSDGRLAAVHAGWRGLEAGVVTEAVAAVRQGGHGVVEAAVGPHIGVADYEFGPADLDRLSERFGSSVVGRTRSGRPALDLAAALDVELAQLGVSVVARDPRTTADHGLWSHRLRADTARFATVAWRTAP